MNPQRLFGVALLIGGIVLLVMGLNAMDSFGSQVSKFFTGSPTDKAVWMTIGGVVLIVLGAGAGLVPLRGAKS
jgi:uncharacterized membrane protein YidH (DUF202 family)